MLRRPFLIATTALAMLTLTAALPAVAADPRVEFDTTAGNFTVELNPAAAPKTVANFLDYVNAKHYDGSQFHRVIPGFMIQGGGFTPDFQQKPTKAPIAIESEQSSKAGLLNVPGTIAMARTGDPNLATAQFFINVNDNKPLNFRSADAQGYGYTVFGKVVSGMDVVDKIAKTPTGSGGPFPRDVPTEKVIITKAFVIAAKCSRQRGMVILHTNKGAITLDLDAENAPGTVANFLQYVRDGHYDNTVFHRVIDGFMIQGGGMAPGLKQKPVRAPIANEAVNGLKNKRYTVAMARTSEPHSATAQFFINVNDNGFLDHTSPSAQGWGYCVFGKVAAGTDVVDAIKGVATGNSGAHQNVHCRAKTWC